MAQTPVNMPAQQEVSPKEGNASSRVAMAVAQSEAENGMIQAHG